MSQRRPVRMPSPVERFIEAMVRESVLTFDLFGYLESGRCSPYRFDLQKIGSGRVLSELISAWAEVVNEHFRKKGGNYRFDVLYGSPDEELVLGALAQTLDRVAPGFSSRFWSGDGINLPIMGSPIEQKNRVLVVATDIASLRKRQTAKLIRDLGGELVGVVVPFDGQEKEPGLELSAAQQFAWEYRVPVHAAATLDDLIRIMEEKSGTREVIPTQLREYRKRHCVTA